LTDLTTVFASAMVSFALVALSLTLSFLRVVLELATTGFVVPGFFEPVVLEATVAFGSTFVDFAVADPLVDFVEATSTFFFGAGAGAEATFFFGASVDSGRG
jgi:hypothetical protein